MQHLNGIFQKFFVVSSLIVLSTSLLHAKEFVIDSIPDQQIKQIVLFAGSLEAVQLHTALIESMPDVKFKVLISVDGDKASYNYPNVEAIPFPKPLTDWAQDRLVRLHENNKPLLAASMSTRLFDAGVYSFETGTIPYLDFPTVSKQETKLLSIDNSNGEVTVDADFPKFFKGRIWKYIYGDGGDRIATKKILFVGYSTFNEILKNTGMDKSQLETMYNKKIIVIDSDNEAKRFGFHIDLYMTPIDTDDGLVVLLANPMFTMQKFFDVSDVNDLPGWVDKFRWQQRIDRYNLIREQLEDIEVVDMPVFYIDGTQPVTITWNNGIFHNGSFFTGDGINKIDVKGIRQYINNVFHEYDISVTYLDGVYKTLRLGGGVRCTSAVVDTSTIRP